MTKIGRMHSILAVHGAIAVVSLACNPLHSNTRTAAHDRKT